jgi:NTP pyrophosphatase (non-canonical NTP hydrolase)
MVQVGAVANVVVEDIDTPSTDGRYIDVVQSQVFAERQRQIEKWGPQTQLPPVWMAILMEEVGEAADELDLDEIDNANFRGLVEAIGALGRVAKGYLKDEFGWD